MDNNGTGDLLINTADGEKIYIDTSEIKFKMLCNHILVKGVRWSSKSNTVRTNNTEVDLILELVVQNDIYIPGRQFIEFNNGSGIIFQSTVSLFGDGTTGDQTCSLGNGSNRF